MSLRKRGSRLIWPDEEMTGLAPHDRNPGRPAMFSDGANPVFPDDQGPVRIAPEADDRDGGQPFDDASSGLDGAGRHDALPTAEGLGRPDPGSPCLWTPEPRDLHRARERHRFARTGEGASSSSAMGNGLRASMAHSASALLQKSAPERAAAFPVLFRRRVGSRQFRWR